MKKLLRLQFIPTSTDLALLLLRLWFGLPLLLLHGAEKAMNYTSMAGSFPDPLGLGSHLSLGLAILGEGVCSILVILGLFTRLAALGAGFTMAVAFWRVHHLVLSGQGSGELAYVYLGAFLALLVAGPGRFSLDARAGGAKA